MHQRTLIATVAGLSTVVGCSGTQSDRAHAVRDSVGVEIVQNPTLVPSDHPEWHITEPPMLTIGVGPTDDDQLFGVVSAFRLSDGRIAIANGGSYDVRVFAADGRFLQAMGRRGDGPGEFRSVYGMYRLQADSIAVYDTQQQRMTVFAPDGAFARLFSVRPPEGATRLVPVGPLGDTQWLMVFSQQIGPPVGPGYVRLTLYLSRHDQAGSLIDTVAVLPGFEIFVHTTDNGRVVPAVPFGRGVGVATRDQEFLVAPNGSYEVQRYSSTGMLRAIVRRSVSPRPVTTTDLERAREAELAQYSNLMQRGLLIDAYENMRVPATMPAVGGPAFERMPWILPSPSAGFWVLDYMAPGDTVADWSVFDQSGRLVQSVHLPGRIKLFEVGEDYILGLQRDSLDVETVLLYRISTR